MGNKLKAISKVSVALALLGAAVPAVEAAPTAMAAKKVTKKAKKSTKKVVKKSTKKAKKAKKATKKVAKKTAAKKPAKKSVKKTTKKVVKKPVAKKSVKKVAKKPVAKKPAKKAVKKPAKKSVKKPVAKKPAKKVVKKTTTKKPAKKFVKHVTMADKYQPKVKSSTVNIDWGTDFYDSDNDYINYSPVDFITNKSSLPSGVYFYYLDYVDTSKSGTYKTRILAHYDDGSEEVVGTVTFVVQKSDAEKYPPTVKDVTLNWGDSFGLRKDAITNALGYFPKNTKFSYDIDGYDEDGYDDDDRYFTYKSGTYNAHLSVEYPDGSSEMTKEFKITVLPSDADKAKLSLKSSNFTVSTNETLEHLVDNDDSLSCTLNDPTRFLNIGSALPKGTLIQFDSVDSDFYPSHPAPGKYETSLYAYFPDGSVYRTDKFTVDVK
ncbi:Rib/alpha-like domain-containing protein [Lactobacillus equicursoris]|uniref:Rib/alpha-like domain-containing protein n=1 Tax=Lactobacillus equicursoris TaxID=420645 RepID=UPI0039955BCC